MDKLIDKIRLRRLKDEAIEVREKIQKLREELGIPTSQTEIELLDKQGFVKQAMSPLQFYFTLAATLAAAGFLMTNEALNYMSGETALRKALKKRIEERNLELAREEQSPMVTLRSYLELI